MNRPAYTLAIIATLIVLSFSYQNRVAATDSSIGAKANGLPVSTDAGSSAQKGETAMRITVSSDRSTVVYRLNDSSASRELYAQLPMSVDVEKYGGNEIIFYPPKKLATSDTPLAKPASRGTLAYYAPWGDVVMFYGSFGSVAGLYELGSAISGSESIQTLSGTVFIDKDLD